jgi:hypothetical protein
MLKPRPGGGCNQLEHVIDGDDSDWAVGVVEDRDDGEIVVGHCTISSRSASAVTLRLWLIRSVIGYRARRGRGRREMTPR